jgi:phosphate-selective porin OprO/OprP
MKTKTNRIRSAHLAGLLLAGVISGPAMANTAAPHAAAAANDTKLLDALLKNGVINKTQYHELLKAGGNFTNDALLSVLAQNGAITKDQASTLAKGQAPAGTTPAPAVTATPAIAKEAKTQDSYVHMNEKGLEFGNNDGNFKMKIGGRMQVDSQISYNPSSKSGAPADTQLSDGVELRRARLYAEGLLWHDYEFRFEYDFARNWGGTSGITDAYVKYIRFAPFSITVGQQNEGKSMESTMSNNYLTFIERGLPNNAYIEQSSNSKYQLGITAQMFDKAWGVPYVFNGGLTTVSMGYPLMSQNPNQTTASTAQCFNTTNTNGGTGCQTNNQNSYSGNVTYQLVGRGVVLPYKDDDGNLIHVGAWGSGRTLTNTLNQNGTIRNGGWQFAAQPDTNVDRTNYVNTYNMSYVNSATGKTYLAQHVNQFGAELAGAYGPFHTTTEYMWANVLGQNYTGNNSTQGFSTNVGWFITGETRPYDEKKGTWNRVIPKSNFATGSGGWGAWEMAARYDLIDLNTNSKGGQIQGGAMDIGTLGLNWYMTPRVRIMTNWVHVFSVNNGGAPTNGNCNSNGTSPGIGCYNGVTPNVWETALRMDF